MGPSVTVGPVITRWRVGKPNLSQRWTEFIGRVMRAHETPEEAAEAFNRWMETGEWK